MDATNVVIELTGKEKGKVGSRKEQHQSNTGVAVAFRSHVGFDGVLILLFMLLNSGLLIYVTYAYSNRFATLDREWVWVFLLLALLYILLFIFSCVTWKGMAIKFAKESLQERKEPRNRQSLFETGKRIYSDWKIDGKYFLIKLYALEVFESFNQLLNMFTLYTCSLPVGVTVGMGGMLSIDAFHTAWVMSKNNDPSRRNRQIKVDLVMDFVCTALPLLFMHFGYGVSISILEMLRIIVIPSLSAILKIDDVFEEIVRFRSEIKEIKKSLRRKSTLQHVRLFSMATMQEKIIPRWLRSALKFQKIVLGACFLLVSIVHLALHAEVDCDASLWEHCKLKVPFCGSMFTPSCDCAVLEVQRHNWTTLPDGVKDMRSLKTMRINHGPLKTVPRFGKFSRLTDFDLSYNMLDEIPVHFETPNVVRLIMTNNNIHKIPKEIWGYQELVWVQLDNNNVSKIPSEVNHLMQLQSFLLSNNSLLTLPSELGTMTLLLDLFVDGNNLTNIPSSLFDAMTLWGLRLNNNRIVNIPRGIGKLARLNNIDLRNNAIDALPDDFANLKRLKYAYLYGNPICSNGWLSDNAAMRKITDSVEGGCNAQCSPYCQNRYTENSICGRECNSEVCDYDGGACL
jgi:Leucine-rich repeat (LRR) protein